MNDKIKLIIEIDKYYYELIKFEAENHLTDYKPFVIIANGTPLDEKEPTYEEVIEYCKKRHLDLVTHAFMHTLLNGGDK